MTDGLATLSVHPDSDEAIADEWPQMTQINTDDVLDRGGWHPGIPQVPCIGV
jgi:hypothetical protein